MKTAVFVAAALTLAITAAAQSPQPAPAPRDPAIVFPVPDLHAQLDKLVADAKAKGSSGATIEDYGSYKIQLSVRSVSGGAEVHAHWDDVMMVEQGSATLITGGTVIDGKTGADGETHGAKIDGGHSQTISPGDVLTVRAGTPHQLILEPGAIYGAVVVKIHEP
jgi:mannose-6-phosphate isomerase-like protein (cupin superfamily)